MTGDQGEVGVALGRQEENGDSKTHLVEIWRMPFCLTGSRLMTIRGIKGQKTLGAMHACVCAYVLIGVFVVQTEYERWKCGREGWGERVAVVWLEASLALHRDPFESMRETPLILEFLIH